MNAEIFLGLRITLALLLYGFLGWGFYMLWLDFRQQARRAVSPQVPALTLVLHNNDQARVYHFTQPEVNVGRDPASECYLEDQTISAQHARLSYHHGQWWLEDMHSTNGTFLNQEAVQEPLVVASGDQIRFGQVQVHVALDDHQNPGG